ncbi:MAG: ABC-type transport auxiliary lipoprotein family protein [Phycisphaerales bacterium]
MTPFRRLAPALLAPVFLLGCNLVHPYPERAYYTLPAPEDAGAPALEAASTPIALAVPRAVVAPPYDTRSFQYRVADAGVEPAYYAQWAADPGELIAGAVSRTLASSGVAIVPDEAAGAARVRLLIEVADLSADVRTPGAPRAVITLRATLVDERGEILLHRTAGAAHDAATAAPDDILTAWSAGLGEILEDLAPPLRTAVRSASK